MSHAEFQARSANSLALVTLFVSNFVRWRALLDTLFSLYFRLCLATDTSQARLEIRQESLARHVPIYRIFQIDLMISQGYLLVIYFLAEG